jgi:hypothetical protein
MILSDIFQRFVQDSPLTVMTQAILENALPPATVDELFEDYADSQYTRKLLFSDVVNLMSMVVCSIRPSINSAFKKLAPTLGVTRKAVYDKINRVETTTSAALVRHTGTVLTPVIDELGARVKPLLDGYRTRLLDGNHLAGTQHRLEELRTIGSAPLPGQSLVVLDPELRLVVDVIPCEDGHAQERSLTNAILALVQPRELWIADRNFCTTQLLYGITSRQAFFIIRQHARNLYWELVGERRDCGRIETGQVFEQTIQTTNDAGEVLFLRRVTVVLDKPTRDGDTEIHVLTNLPHEDASAPVIAELYRKRWTIETAFQELEETLQSEINTLGYPKAALFGFALAVTAYNLLVLVRQALAAGREGPAVAEISSYYLANEVAAVSEGMAIAVPAEQWQRFAKLSVAAFAEWLRGVVGGINWRTYRKSRRGPKKPVVVKRTRRGAHRSTARVLENHAQSP